MFRMPFADNSVDVVYTVHAIEPNFGMEEKDCFYSPQAMLAYPKLQSISYV